MSNASDFIIENGVLTKYVGPGGDVVIPERVTAIGRKVFYINKTITTVDIPAGVTSIAEEAFWGSSITGVDLPAGLIHIAANAFGWCSDLTDITIPDSVQSIGNSAFFECTKLRSITLPASIPKIDECAFCGCESLKDENGFVIVADILFGYFGDGGEVTIPAGVTKIGALAFAQARGITCLKIPTSVESIDKEALGGFTENALIVAPHLSIEAFQTSQEKRYAVLGFLRNLELYSDPAIFGAYQKYAIGQRKKLLSEIFLHDAERAIAFYAENKKITAANFESEYMEPAAEMKAVNCVAYLMDWKNTHLANTIESKQSSKELTKDPFNATDMKKIWNYRKLENGTLEITGYKGADKAILVPARIGKDSITVIGEMAFDPHAPRVKNSHERHYIESIIVSEGIVRIDKLAFSSLANMTDITLPESVVDIAGNAFMATNMILHGKIHAPAGSYAETYAKEHNIPFVAE